MQLDDDEEIVDITIDNKGVKLPKTGSKIGLIDADTIIYASCSMLTYTEELLPMDMYTDKELEDIHNDPGYIEELGVVDGIDLEDAFRHSMEKIDYILGRTGCKDFELHFTIGRKSFPYTMVSKEYKANRTQLSQEDRPPYGIRLLKNLFLERFPGKVFLNDLWEADHIVVCKKRDEYDKYELIAVDKDVLKAIPGKMFNYYQSIKYNIDMKWIENTVEEARKRYYVQTLTGDAGDNVIGLKGVGPKTAEKTLANCETLIECWTAVLAMYVKKGRDEIDAITNMRLVDMKQLKLVDGEYKVALWFPPIEGQEEENYVVR